MKYDKLKKTSDNNNNFKNNICQNNIYNKWLNNNDIDELKHSTNKISYSSVNYNTWLNTENYSYYKKNDIIKKEITKEIYMLIFYYNIKSKCKILFSRNNIYNNIKFHWKKLIL